MIPVSSYKDKKVVVLGLGKSGLSAAHALMKAGAQVIAWDDNKNLQEAAKNDHLNVIDPTSLDWQEVDVLLQSPGIPHTLPKPHPVSQLAKDAQVPLIYDVDVLIESQPKATFIGITGTNGKSTTTALTTHVLKFLGYPAQQGGNIGMPALDLNPSGDTFVLELSSYHTELMQTKGLASAVILNITPDHLDRHGTMEGYAAAKENIFNLLKDGGTAVISLDDSYCQKIYDHLKGCALKVIPISVHQEIKGGIYVVNHHLINHLGDEPQVIADLEHLPTLKGEHNYQNIAAVYGLLVHHYALEGFQQALESYPGLAHRQEIAGHLGQVTVINDSKATNLESVTKSLAAFDNIYWILGGLMKDGGDDISLIQPFFSKIRKAYTIGSSAAIYKNLLHGHIEVVQLETLDQATQMALKDAAESHKPATVLLSPACASWDQFKSFEHRGDVFKQVVKEWIQHHDA